MADVVSLQLALQSLLGMAVVAQIHHPAVQAPSSVIISLDWKTAGLHGINHEPEATEVT